MGVQNRAISHCYNFRPSLKQLLNKADCLLMHARGRQTPYKGIPVVIGWFYLDGSAIRLDSILRLTRAQQSIPVDFEQRRSIVRFADESDCWVSNHPSTMVNGFVVHARDREGLDESRVVGGIRRVQLNGPAIGINRLRWPAREREKKISEAMPARVVRRVEAQNASI